MPIRKERLEERRGSDRQGKVMREARRVTMTSRERRADGEEGVKCVIVRSLTGRVIEWWRHRCAEEEKNL